MVTGIGYRSNKDSEWQGGWLEQPENEAHDSIFHAVKKLDYHQRVRLERMLDYVQMYTNQPINSLGGKNYNNSAELQSDALVHNVAKNLVDAATSKISTRKVKIMFLTTGGNPEQKRRAELLNKFIAGQHAMTNLHRHARRAFRDACIYGRGFLKVFDDGCQIKVEQVHPYEIIVDDEESKYGDPRQMFQHKEVSRSHLMKLYPEFSTAIEGAINRRWEDMEHGGTAGISDSVSVIEAWHLPTSPAAGDGRHVIAISSATLLDEPWERDTFPFSSIHWSEPVLGFWGYGICEEVKEKQFEINFLERKAQQEMNLGAVRVFTTTGNNLAKTKISNEIGAVYEVNDMAGFQIHNANMVAPESWQQIQKLTAQMYEVTGISQLSAQSQKPSGLDSGKALREFSDIESERFAHVHQMYEESILDASTKMVQLAREISERDDESSYKVLADEGDSLRELKWSDVKIDEHQYVMKVYPTNFLPSTPSGQWQQVQEMLQAGFLGREEGMALLDYPDLKSVSNRLNAVYKIVEQDIYMMLVEGEAMTPESYYNLELTGRVAQTAYLQARIEKYPEDKLDLVRRYIDRVQELANPPAPPMPAAPAMAAQPGNAEPMAGQPSLPPEMM